MWSYSSRKTCRCRTSGSFWVIWKRTVWRRRQYRYALYSRFVTPVSVLLMLFISVPFVFGSLRSTGTGQRFLVGIMAGFGYFLANQLAGQAGQVYGWSPLLVSIVPGLAVMLAGIYALRRV